jgi:hypothetical protein
MSKAEAIIRQFYPDAKLGEFDCFNINKVIVMMKEIGSLAFAAGMDSTMKNTTLVHKTYQTGKKTDIAAIQKDKEQFISKLFGE